MFGVRICTSARLRLAGRPVGAPHSPTEGRGQKAIEGDSHCFAIGAYVFECLCNQLSAQ